jgi:hypothetical protein
MLGLDTVGRKPTCSTSRSTHNVPVFFQETAKNKTSHRNIPWLVVSEQTDALAVTMQATRGGCSRINKNATDMGASVAVLSLNQTIWLNCCAETRP